MANSTPASVDDSGEEDAREDATSSRKSEDVAELLDWLGSGTPEIVEAGFEVIATGR